MYQFIAILVGLASGITWEELGTTPYKNIATITPSLIIAYKTSRLTHLSALMIFSFLLGAMAYNFCKFPDWYIFLK